MSMKMSLRSNNYTYGYHTTKLPSLYDTVSRVVGWNTVTAMQIYLSNGRGYASTFPSEEDLTKTRELMSESRMWVCAHSKLVHNPAGAKDMKNPKWSDMLSNTRDGLMIELDTIAAIGGHGVVVHTGCCEDREFGLRTIADTIVTVLIDTTTFTDRCARILDLDTTEFVKRRRIILENSAGEGSKLGGTLEDFAYILDSVPNEYHSQIGVCIDTAHAFGAGLCDWGIPERVEEFYHNFNDIIGLKFLSMFHLNDSRKSEKKALDAPFGSKKDRHANLGMGYVFEGDRVKGLKKFFELAYVHNIPIIGEPPSSTDDTIDPGPGGIRDFLFVKDLLDSTSFPLFTIHTFHLNKNQV